MHLGALHTSSARPRPRPAPPRSPPAAPASDPRPTAAALPAAAVRPAVAAAGAAILVLGRVAALPAQENDRGARGDTLRARRSAVLRSLRPGQSVRLGLAGGERVEGDVLRLADDGLVLDRAAAGGGRDPRPIPPEAMERLWTRSSSWGRGALVGGAAGAVPGAIFGHELGQFACAETSDDCGLEGALLGGALLGAGGALLGAGVGALIPHWSLRFP